MVQLNIGDVVTHEPFGDGKIDQCAERGGVMQFHVNFVRVSAWFVACDLKRIEPDAEPDPQAVANLEAAARGGYTGA